MAGPAAAAIGEFGGSFIKGLIRVLAQEEPSRLLPTNVPLSGEPSSDAGLSSFFLETGVPAGSLIRGGHPLDLGSGGVRSLSSISKRDDCL